MIMMRTSIMFEHTRLHLDSVSGECANARRALATLIKESCIFANPWLIWPKNSIFASSRAGRKKALRDHHIAHIAPRKNVAFTQTMKYAKPMKMASKEPTSIGVELILAFHQ
jgi:hypothetical protein